MSPLIIFELLVFVAPFIILIRISLSEQSQGIPYAEGTFSIASYIEVIRSELLQGIIIYSFQLGVIATVITVTLAVFYAYAAWRASGLLKSALLFSTVSPEWHAQQFAISSAVAPVAGSTCPEHNWRDCWTGVHYLPICDALRLQCPFISEVGTR